MVVTEQWVTVGRIKTVFGVKGWLKVESYTQPIENILEYSEWRIENESGIVNKQIYDTAKVRDKDIVVHFKGLDDRDKARQLTQCLIKVPMHEMPLLQDNDFYWHQLQGLKVFQVEKKGEAEPCLIGVVDHLLETGANDVLVLKAPKTEALTSAKTSKAADILIPYLPDQVVKKVDLENGLILVDWYYD